MSTQQICKLKTIIEVSIAVSCYFSRWNIRDEDLLAVEIKENRYPGYRGMGKSQVLR